MHLFAINVAIRLMLCYNKCGDDMNKFHYNSINLEIEHQRFENPFSKEHLLHAHAYYEVCLFLEGEGSYCVEGSEYPLQPGDVVVLRPEEAHYVKVSSDTPFERILLSFGKHFMEALDPEKELYPPFWNREPGRQNLYRSADFSDLQLGEHFFNMETDTARQHVVTHLLALLGDLNLAFRRMPSYEQSRETLEAAVIRLINDNYHQELSLQELSDRFFISRAQLCRRFQKATGTSIGRYITIKRLNAARKLLLQGRKASDACAMCGFKDYTTFYRAYVRHFGCSPTGR